MDSLVSAVAAFIIRSTERLGVRGGPSLLRMLSSTGLGRNASSIVSLPSGERICFQPVDPYWAPYLWGRRAYEPDVEAIFRRLAAIPDKILVDCGANIGFWTVRLSNPEFGFGRFIAIEPNPKMIPLLKRNIELNRIDCRLVHGAISDEAGRIAYLADADQHAVAALSDQGIPVETTSLDSLLLPDEIGGRLAVVKLDVEGAEVAAIEGARELSRADLVFVYEDWRRSGFPVTRYLLKSGHCVLGVHLDGIGERIGSLEDADRFNRSTHTSYGPSNLVACSPATFGKIARFFEL